MQTRKWILQYSFLVLSLSVCYGNASVPKITSRVQWVWYCNNNDRCERISAEEGATFKGHLRMHESLAVCRLTCGTYGALWPRPTISTVLAKDFVTFDPGQIRFQIQKNVIPVRKYIVDMTKMFVVNLGRDCGVNCSSSVNTDMLVRVFVYTDVLDLSWDTDESYTLNVTTIGNLVTVEINSATVFGARHGVETLSQLIAPQRSKHRQELAIVAGVQISDRPVYPHRGLLLDTARSFIPVKAIERTLDAMGASKLNVFHWHVTDSQSFPLESSRIPQLTRYGAYSSKEVYHPFEVKHIIDYAKLRGVRVILEIDAPAHAGNGWQWGPEAGLGDLALCVNQQPWRKYCIQAPCGQLNPANPNVYRVLRDLYKDLIEMLPYGEVIHMGGDEVYFPCWNSSKEITDLLKARGYGTNVEDFLQLWAEFQTTVLNIWDEQTGRSPSDREDRDPPIPVMLWSSHLTEPSIIEQYLQKDRYVIETWTTANSDEPARLLQKGYRIVMATKDAWYLDHGFWGSTSYHSWRKAYLNRIPRTAGVLGGEACMWSELVDDNSLDSRIWPRAAAVAERLWADPESDATAAEPRFYRHRERLVSRGIRPEALAPKWCLQNEGLCS